MAVFKVNLTDDGKVLLARANAGEQMSIVAIVLGSGVWTAEQQANFNLSALVEQKMSLGIASSERTGEVYKVQAVLSNASLAEGFAVRELGVIVEIEDAGAPTQYLYLAGYAGDQYTYIVDKDTAPVSYPVPVTITVGRTENITVEIADQVFATKEDINVHDLDPEAHQPLVDRLHVSQPAITSPASGQLNVIETPTFQCGAFETHFAGVTHTHSQWQVALASASDWLSPAHDSGADAVNLTSYAMPSGVLAVDTVYKVRCRHRCGPDGLWSEWSPTITFTTKDVFTYVATPTCQSPQNGATGQGETPTLTSSAFAVVGDSDSHIGSQWQLDLATGDFSSPVHDTGEDATNLESFTLAAGILAVATQYKWRVRHKGTAYGLSEWSQPFTFTTLSAFISGDDAVVFTPGATDFPIVQNMDIGSGLVATADDAYAYSAAEVQGAEEGDWAKLTVQAKVKHPEELAVGGSSTTSNLVLTSDKSGLLANGDKILVNDGAAGTDLTEQTVGSVVDGEELGDLCTDGTPSEHMEAGGYLAGGSLAGVFDDDEATYGYWLKSAASAVPMSVIYEWTEGRVVTGYTITCDGANLVYCPKAWTFDAWDGAQWVNLNAQANITSWTGVEKKTFNFSNATAYSKYRIRITEGNGDPSTQQIRIHEMEMLGQIFNGQYICTSINPALSVVPDVAFLPVTLHEADGTEGTNWDSPGDFPAVALGSASYIHTQQPNDGSYLAEDCADKSDWTEDNDGGAVTTVTHASQDAFKFDSGAGTGAAVRAALTRDPGSLTASVDSPLVIDIDLYHEALGVNAGNDAFRLSVHLGSSILEIQMATDGLFVNDNGAYAEIGTDLVQTAQEQNWRFVWDGADLKTYLGGSLQATTAVTLPGAGTDGKVWIGQYGVATANSISYVYALDIGWGQDFKTLSLTSQEVEPAQSFRQVGMGVSNVADGSEIIEAQVNLWKQGA